MPKTIEITDANVDKVIINSVDKKVIATYSRKDPKGRIYEKEELTFWVDYPTRQEIRLDENGGPVLDANGDPIYDEVPVENENWVQIPSDAQTKLADIVSMAQTYLDNNINI